MIDIEEYLKIERSIPDLDEEKVNGVPIWRLCMTEFRRMVRDSSSFTVTHKLNLGELFINYFKSFWGLTCLALFGKDVDALFFPHPRLFYVEGKYLERLSDPLIDTAGLQKYLILERNQNGIHKRPRYHNSHVVYLDFIDVTVRIISLVVKPMIRMKYNPQIESLYKKLDGVFQLKDNKYKSLFTRFITNYLIARWLILPVLKKLHPKTVFLAPRGTYDYAIQYFKQKGTRTIELQHGIVLKESDLYSSSGYNPDYDPDFFFVFGESNIGPQYGMPIERVINIGYPYKNFLHNLESVRYGDNIALVVSEPEITDKIIDALLDIVTKYPQYEFHIRCHPQEKFKEEHYKKIAGCSQIKVVDNHVESFYAISRYNNVVGENSSVLFEAMSLHKKVARLSYCGLESVNTVLIHGGTIINNADDYHTFMVTPYSDVNDSKDLYSDYQPSVFNKIVDMQ